MTMRTIKFRGKNIHTGEWSYGNLAQFDNGCCVDDVTVDRSTVGQFIGMLDSHGKEIYEGDILRSPLDNIVVVKFGYKEHIVKHGVFTDSFAAYGWIVENVKNGITDFLDNEFLQGEVIGNIHDNPEMLKGGSNGES